MSEKKWKTVTMRTCVTYVKYVFTLIAWSFLFQFIPLYKSLLALFSFEQTVDTPIIHT